MYLKRGQEKKKRVLQYLRVFVKAETVPLGVFTENCHDTPLKGIQNDVGNDSENFLHSFYFILFF